MNKTFATFFLFSAAFLLLSCEKTEKIENFPMSPSKLVLNCQLNPDSVITLLLFKSLSVLDNAPNKNITTAKVELYKDNLLIASLPSANNNFKYVFEGIKPETNHKYKVVATATGYEPIWAEVTVPQDVFPDKLSTSVSDTFTYVDYYYSGDTSYSTIGKINVTLTDPAANRNFYKIKIYYHNIYYEILQSGDTITYISNFGLYSYNNNSMSPLIDFNLGFDYFFTDQYFNGSQVTIDIPIMYSGMERSINVFAELISVSEEQYLYDKSKMVFNNNNGNPFTEPIQIYTNVNNGFGIFSGINGNVQTVKFN